MESMTFIPCHRMLLVSMALVVLLASVGTCRASTSDETSPGVHHRQQQQQQQAATSTSSDDAPLQSPQQLDEIQREWDELLWHCRGVLPARPVRRLGSEFLGKRSPPSDGPSLINAAVQWCSDEFSQNHWLCTCLFPTSDSSDEVADVNNNNGIAPVTAVDETAESADWTRPSKRGLGAILLSGKRMNAKWANPLNRRIMGSEFLGKRASPLGSEFLGKRASRPLGSEFLG